MSTVNDTAAPPLSSTHGDQVENLCSFLESAHPEDASPLCQFARLFFAKVPRSLLAERSLEELGALTTGAFEFLQRTRPNQVNVEVINPEEEGWTAPVTLIRAEVGDRPFIVDTIREFLSAEELSIQHYIYPVLRVERDEQGRIVSIGEPTGGNLEALVHCEITRIADPEWRRMLCKEVERRLRDVVAATNGFSSMLGALDDTIEVVEGYRERFPDREQEWEETINFLRWLREENFVFLGYRAYDIDREGEWQIRVEPGSGLGILRNEQRSTYHGGVSLTELSEALQQRIIEGPVLIISKANAESPVHRRARMDYIGVKKLDEQGRVVGERRFLGLFTSKAYGEDADHIPILRRKLHTLLERSGAPRGSHDYKEIITIFNSMPKQDLFQASPAELEREVQTVLALLFSDQVRVTLRPDPIRRGVSVMVILPRGKFSAEVRQRIQNALAKHLQGTVLNYHLALGAGDQARLHFYLSAPQEVIEQLDTHEVEREITRLIRSWEDDLLAELVRGAGGAAAMNEAQHLTSLYAPAFSEEYRAIIPPAIAVYDIKQLERMRREEQDVAITLRTPSPAEDHPIPDVSILNLYLQGERLVLSDFMPILENAGVRVIEVNPHSATGPDLPLFTIYSFVVQGLGQKPISDERAPVLAETLLAAHRGDAPNDIFNTLTLAAGLRWREIEVLRAYVNYAFQIGAVPARLSTARILARHREVARLLLELFRVRFDPEGPTVREPERAPEVLEALRGALQGALETITTLADDRALRRLFNLIEATTRTNFYRHGGADPTARSGGVPYVSIKIRCADVEELKKNRLLYEIYVHSARMEGIHLRGAPVSRGGIRWSDRPDDFRTEILGLVQTQVVKNAVIVPGGSKGGFITQRVFSERDAMMEEAAAQYRTLMRGLLDITDNIVDGEVVPPPGVLRYDGDDPYLVVAADKGTAHLSDVANTVAAEYDFWLDDAFASGGSQGYDHKREGITARGAWECVKRHFRELGKDIQTEPFTVVGIGDMSGDVFGNGMLLSRQIRLVAAFDHRHIFLDPDPDPAVSYAERERLFQLPRSSWADYDRSKLSPGGMIVPRASKEVAIPPEVRRALGLEDAADKLDGEALIRAVLKAPVELLWNGGIGTYVKHPEETHAEAGDTTNDPVRVDADQLRCKVVGEGGNLGFTQRARVAYALRGGRINTDALDNSAGVDMSDHEVNLKILLNPLVTAEKMAWEERNRLLEGMTDEVSALVLQNNIGQSLAVSLDEQRSQTALADFAALISALERDRVLDRGAEGLPTSDTIQERAESGIGLTRPALCVLLAYAKLYAKGHLLRSDLMDDPAMLPYLVSYFPPAATEAAGRDRLRQHRLRREIVTTELVNDLVELMGSSFLHRTMRDTGSDLAAVARAWLVASRISGAPALRADLQELEGRLPSAQVYRWYFGLARVLDRTTRWVLGNVDPEVGAETVIERHREGLSRLRTEFPNVVSGEDRVHFETLSADIQELGVEASLAARIITLRFLPQLLDILRIAEEAQADVVETARAYYGTAERFACGGLRQMLRISANGDLWERRLAQVLVEDVDRAQRAITRIVLLCHQRDGNMEHCFREFEERHRREVGAYRELLAELRDCEEVPLAAGAVATRTLRGIAEG